jgi:hypothetical protein
MLLVALRWLSGRVLRLVPGAILGRVLPSSFRFRATPQPPAAPPTKVRLFIAPVNWAGQAWQWARAVERNLDDVGAVSMAYRMGTDFAFPVDGSVPVGAYVASGVWQRRQFEAVRDGFTHVLIEAERQPFGAVLDESVRRQVDRLLRGGLKVAMLCHGSDIRLPSRHAATEPDSPFRDSLWKLTPRLERQAARNRALLSQLGLPVFVSTPDLLLDVPEATWLPVVVDADRWSTDAVPLDRELPVVVHAPSKAVVKGSDLIDPILRRLDAEGVLTYRRLQGVPADAMIAAVQDADIVVDQFRIGSYGVAACEAMAAGRVVVSHVSDQVRSHVRSNTGVHLPIVQARAGEVEGVLRDILSDRTAFRSIAAAGADFVRTVHDGRRSAQALRPFLR